MNLDKRDIFNIVAGRPLQGPENLVELKPDEIVVGADQHKSLQSLIANGDLILGRPLPPKQVQEWAKNPSPELREEMTNAHVDAIHAAFKKPSLLERISKVAEWTKDMPDWKRGSPRNTRKPFIRFKCMGDTGAIFPREAEHQAGWVGHPIPVIVLHSSVLL